MNEIKPIAKQRSEECTHRNNYVIPWESQTTADAVRVIFRSKHRILIFERKLGYDEIYAYTGKPRPLNTIIDKTFEFSKDCIPADSFAATNTLTAIITDLHEADAPNSFYMMGTIGTQEVLCSLDEKIEIRIDYNNPLEHRYIFAGREVWFDLAEQFNTKKHKEISTEIGKALKCV